jgi:hypothetical protein
MKGQMDEQLSVDFLSLPACIVNAEVRAWAPPASESLKEMEVPDSQVNSGRHLL